MSGQPSFDVNPAPAVIELSGLSVRFGRREILKDLSIALAGEPSVCSAPTAPENPR